MQRELYNSNRIQEGLKEHPLGGLHQGNLSKSLAALEGIFFRYDPKEDLVLEDFSLSIGEGEIFCLLGESGCGKTTCLQLLGGFLFPEKGKILIEGKDYSAFPPEKRPVSTVFQSYALFPHMTVLENVCYGLKWKGFSKREQRDRAEKYLDMMKLWSFRDRMVTELSGGQQQRVALARSLAVEPKLLLMDEPLSNLDAGLRKDIREELADVQRKIGLSMLFVTHDQEEALTMSDTIVVMNQGYIQQMGTPEQIYNEPENAFVADFIGDSNIIPAIMVHDELVNIFGANFRCVDKGFGQNQPVDVVIRPEDVELVKPEDGILTGHVTHSIFKGVHYEMEVTTKGGYEWLVQSTRMFTLGQEVGITVDPFNIQIMNKPASEDEEAIVNE